MANERDIKGTCLHCWDDALFEWVCSKGETHTGCYTCEHPSYECYCPTDWDGPVVCLDDRYDSSGLAFDDVADFEAMCESLYGEAPSLDLREFAITPGWYDAQNRLILRLKDHLND